MLDNFPSRERVNGGWNKSMFKDLSMKKET